MKVPILSTIEKWRSELPAVRMARGAEAVAKALDAIDKGADLIVARTSTSGPHKTLKLSGEVYSKGSIIPNEKARTMPGIEKLLGALYLVPITDEQRLAAERAERDNVYSGVFEPVILQIQSLLSDRGKAFNRELETRAAMETAIGERKLLDDRIRELEAQLEDAFTTFAGINGTEAE